MDLIEVSITFASLLSRFILIINMTKEPTTAVFFSFKFESYNYPWSLLMIKALDQILMVWMEDSSNMFNTMKFLFMLASL
jgi:hypothetical protein